MSDTKHIYCKERKCQYVPLEDLDSRPMSYRGTANNDLRAMLEKVRGQRLCVSLLFDSTACYNDVSDKPKASSPEMPTKKRLEETVAHFKQSLQLTDKNICELEQTTRAQHLSPQWFYAHRYRITASIFGEILHRRDTTAPDNLVLHILQEMKFHSP